VLRELVAEDAAFVVALTNEPSFIAHIGDRGVRTIADAQQYIETGPWTRYRAHGFGLWLVQSRETGEAMGVCGLLKRDTLPAPDIGFAFRPAFWSRGFALEAARAVKAFARDVLCVPQLLAVVSPINTPSIRLLEKLGLEQDRLMRLSDGAPEVALYAARFDTIPQP
jgi:RimJ/RimL family protein N-acetyltransferase